MALQLTGLPCDFASDVGLSCGVAADKIAICHTADLEC